MRYGTLGRSGLVVSRLALGTMTFGAETGEAEASVMLGAYLDAGGTVIETADVYAGGRSEEIVGRWLGRLDASSRGEVILAGKGRFPVGVTPRDAGLSRRHLRRALEATLRRLGVEHLDLYQVHSWDPLTPWEETLGFLEDAVRGGLVSYVGLSNFTGWQIAMAAAAARGRVPLVSMQPQYNLLAREVEWEILPACRASGLGVLPWSPLGGGWLTGKYRRDVAPTGATRLGEDPERGVEAYGLRGREERTWRVLAAVEGIAARRGVPWSQVALAWLDARDGVASTIIGARTPAQLAENLASADLRLTPEEITMLDAASDPEPSPWPYGAAGIEQRSRPLS
ncbi:MAG: aldo/keto reductase [Propioniciclava sp.]|uniref:aldo/keto reductase n=1 Tax=Propioniciclava sp. TaxID=2038686 RepID=UPI0039E281D4